MPILKSGPGILATACLMALAQVQPAFAAELFPNRPVRFIVTFAPGALNDLIARTLSPRLTDIWGKQVVVDNRPGGNTIIGTEAGARAPADGHTLLLSAISHAINPAVYAKLPYDPVRDFSTVSLIASSPYIMVIHPSISAKSVQEFVGLARAAPGKFVYGSTGTGGSSHLMGAMLNIMAGTQTTHVPYKGLAPALNDLIGGQIHYTFGSYSTVGPHVKSGRLRALAVTSAKRAASTPELPTIAESGFPGYEAIPWWGIMTPAATPAAVIARINADVLKALQAPDVKERFVTQGLDVAGSSPQEFAAFLNAEIKRWAGVVKQANVKAE